ncbi:MULTISPECIES: TetR/AcrR family transcriptional regulator [unclassified Agarivorans]|uniref:TetR/AcrR family transcriptional regulator n=1 Tax=unclassified Agarivorans TaxID=2636026 RepID=UPI003D7DE3CA
MENYVVPEHLAMRKQPRQERTRRLVEHILDSTLTLIREQGMAAVNTNLIAQHAEIDIASLYRFFLNKESIFFALAHRWFDKVLVVLDETNFHLASGGIKDYSDSGQRRVNELPETAVMLVSFHELFTHDNDFKALEDWYRGIMITQAKQSFVEKGSAWDDEALTSVCIYFYNFTRNFMAGTIGMSRQEHLQQFNWFQVMLDKIRLMVLQDPVPASFLR